jgi:hypothetical protein
MTVSVALKDGDRVWIGGDRNRINGSRSYAGSNPKVWKVQDTHGNTWAWGQTGTCNLQQVAQYQLTLPALNASEADDLCGFVFKECVPQLYRLLKEIGGITRPDPKSGDGMEGALLLGLLGRIFVVSDLAVTEVDNPFHVVGLGTQPSFGALDAIYRHKIELTPQERIKSAVESASAFFPVIGGGIDIVHT